MIQYCIKIPGIIINNKINQINYFKFNIYYYFFYKNGYTIIYSSIIRLLRYYNLSNLEFNAKNARMLECWNAWNANARMPEYYNAVGGGNERCCSIRI